MNLQLRDVEDDLGNNFAQGFVALHAVAVELQQLLHSTLDDDDDDDVVVVRYKCKSRTD